VGVQDFGAGISGKDLPNIFRRFYRSNAARAGAGYGLGLALAESIARAHHAEIEVKSEVGAGSRFLVHFPARPTPTLGESFEAALKPRGFSELSG
jgi:signal transduction histidine kinase